MKLTVLRIVGAGATLLAVVAVACFALSIDQWYGANTQLGFYAWTIPGGVLFSLLSGFIVRSRILAFLLAGAFVLFVVSFHFIDTGPVKPALRAIGGVRVGMSEPEVRALVAEQFPHTGRFRVPLAGALQGDDLYFTLNVTDGRWNAALLHFRFHSGRIVTAEFLPD